MPKQTLMIVGGIVIIAVLAAGGYFLFNKQKQEPAAPTTQAPQEQTESATKGSIKSLLGKNVTCEITYPVDGQTSTGTIYVSGDKVRGDFKIEAQGVLVDSYFIQDGTYFYGWQAGQPQGVKLKVEDFQSAQASPTSSQFDLDKEVDQKCSPWSVDASKFAPPTNVTFTEVVNPLAPKQSPAGGTQPQGGSPCDSITDPAAKAACLQYAQ